VEFVSSSGGSHQVANRGRIPFRRKRNPDDSLQEQGTQGLAAPNCDNRHEQGRQGSTLAWDQYRQAFVRAQRRLERRPYRQRVERMVYEKQRQEVLKDLGR